MVRRLPCHYNWLMKMFCVVRICVIHFEMTVLNLTHCAAMLLMMMMMTMQLLTAAKFQIKMTLVEKAYSQII